MKKIASLVALTLLNGVSAQVLGTTKKISDTQFCKIHDCQYVKYEESFEGEQWLYYINRRANFDIHRMTDGKNTQATAVTLRLIGSSLTASDLKLASEFLKTAANINILPESLKQCGNSRSEIIINAMSNSKIKAVCNRIDSEEVQIFASVFNP